MNLPEQTLVFACPSCNAELESTSDNSGKVIECPECGANMQVPYPQAVAPASPAGVAPESSSKGKTLRIQSGAARKTVITGRRTSAPAYTPAPKKRNPLGGILFLLLLLGGGASLWFFVLKEEGPPSPESNPAAASADPANTSAGPASETPRTAAPQASDAGPQHTPPPSQTWDLAAPADVRAIEWGANGRQHVEHMTARQNGNLILTGLAPNADAIPATTGKTTSLLPSRASGPLTFVAEISADGGEILWYSYLGADLIEPTRVALGPDGAVFLGGRALSALPGSHPSVQGDFKNRESVVAKLSADGSRLEWAREGGPNSGKVTGLAVDKQGRVLFTTGTRGRGEAAYIMRRNPDGSDSPFKDEWAIRFDVRDDPFKVEGQIGAFYQKGTQGDGFDYDGPGGWAPVRFRLAGMRQGGQIVVLPDGDFVATGTLQYDFRVKGHRQFPAFDLIMARFSPEGDLRWSTNLYQENDSIHTPDQKAMDLVYNPVNGDLYVLVIQHGSNVYRFKGDLYGDTGNLMISWIGRVATDTGALHNGWYWMNSREGNYSESGRPMSPPYPSLAGNRPSAITVDGQGRILFAGNAAPKAWTTSNAWRDWPSAQTGGGNAALLILSPALDQVHYATMIRGEDGDNSSANGLAVNAQGIWVGGWNGTRSFPTANPPAWAPAATGERNNMLVRFRF